MADRVAPANDPYVSLRHGFTFYEVPTVKASVYGGSYRAHHPEDYGAILDCVYEMTDDVASANGETHEVAMAQVLKDEPQWRVLPKHRKAILKKLES